MYVSNKNKNQKETIHIEKERDAYYTHVHKNYIEVERGVYIIHESKWYETIYE